MSFIGAKLSLSVELNLKNKLFPEIQEISKITLNFRPFEGFSSFFWQNLNNLRSLEGIYATENGFLSFNVIILTFLCKF